MSNPPTIAQQIIAGATWISILMLWCCAASVYVSPAHCRWLGVLTLGFPFFVSGVLLMWVLILLFARRYWWVPLMGFAGCCLSLRTYFPINYPSPAPKDCIRVLSYNTYGYGNRATDAQGRNVVGEYIKHSGADIVCVQEGGFGPGHKFDSLMVDICDRGRMQWDTINIRDNIFTVFSRYPILSKRRICADGLNGAVEFRLLLGPGDTLRVVNCHLMSMHLNPEDRQKYVNLVRTNDDDPESSSRMLLSKISQAAVARARQADRVAAYLDSVRGRNVLLCGDFNDSPISYTHHRICAAGLTDAHTSSGCGLGRSFNRDAIVVRIDNIMHSDHWQAYDCHVDQSITASDHYPITCSLKRRKLKE